MDAMQAACHRARSTTISHPIPIVFVVVDELSDPKNPLERLIRSASWEPRTFGSALEFLRHPRACAPSCLILDVDLPDLNGLEARQRQIATDRVEMPIIFITGHSDVPISVKAMKAGAIEFLIKPFDVDTLLDVIAASDRAQRSRACHLETQVAHRPGEVMARSAPVSGRS